jgi:hypothetical protein
MKIAVLRALSGRLNDLRLVDAERDLIEKLDLVDLLGGGLRYAATSAPDEVSARGLVRALETRTEGALVHDVRRCPDDRPARLRERGAPAFVARAIERRPAPLWLAFSWRPGDRPPPEDPPRLRIGRLLGYPSCCIRFEEARRAALVLAEARGMLETWGARTERELGRGIDTRRPFLLDDDVAGDAARIARLRRFPFVSFVPCPRCCERGAGSAAGRENARRRRLARAVDPGLARAIERVRGARSGTR